MFVDLGVFVWLKVAGEFFAQGLDFLEDVFDFVFCERIAGDFFGVFGGFVFDFLFGFGGKLFGEAGGAFSTGFGDLFGGGIFWPNGGDDDAVFFF